MGRGTTRRSPSDLTPSLLGIPYFTIHFASLSMILFVIKKRIFAKYQPLNLCSLTKPSPSPAAPQISAQPEPTPPRASPASPSPAGRSKTPAAARHAQRPREGEEAPAGEEAPSTPPTGPETPTPAQRPGDSPADTGQPSRSSQPPTVSKEQQPRQRPAETDGDRDGEREREGSDHSTHSFSASAHRRRTPARQERPQPQPTPGELDARSRPRLPAMTPSAAPFQFCFWRENRTGAPKPRRNTEERRPPADAAHQRKGGAFTFRTSALITDKHPVPSSSHLNPKNQFGNPFGLTSVQTRSFDHSPYTPNEGSFRHFHQIIFS